MFSSRVTAQLEPNRLTQEILRTRASGRDVIDLTVTNPTVAGIEYPASLLAALGDPASARYDPHPLGLQCAREAVARDYERRGVHVPPDRIVLTASTSEAYSILFKLLCDPAGDSVMVPVPSYPLFEHLTALDGVTASPYPLEYHGRWTVDFQALDERWTSSVRAVLAVSPNNPTGSVMGTEEIEELSARCAARNAAHIIDEVFDDYPLRAGGAGDLRLRATDLPVTGGRSRAGALTFRLGGLSKSVGLPQVKLGWIAIDGPDRLLAEALHRLELICDTYLSVSTPVQAAAGRLLAEGAVVRERILGRVRANEATLRRAVEECPSIEALGTDAGWSAVLRVPATRSEEDLVVELLARDGVLVHPGFFFDFPHEAFVVLSLLPDPARFLDGVRRLVRRAVSPPSASAS
jgi:aspartate/methionine/tyrosine aminotransferase